MNGSFDAAEGDHCKKKKKHNKKNNVVEEERRTVLEQTSRDRYL